MIPTNAHIKKLNGDFHINNSKISRNMNMDNFTNNISYEDYESHRDLYTFTLRDRLTFNSNDLKILVYFNSNVLYDITILQELVDENKNLHLTLEQYENLSKQLLKFSWKKFHWGRIEISKTASGLSFLKIDYTNSWF